MIYTFQAEAPTTQFSKTRKYRDQIHEYSIELTLKNSLSSSRLDTNFQFFNIFLRELLFEQGYIEIRRNMVNPSLTTPFPAGNLTIWSGSKFVIYRSIDGIKLSSDRVTGILRSQSLLEIWKKEYRSRPEAFVREL